MYSVSQVQHAPFQHPEANEVQTRNENKPPPAEYKPDCSKREEIDFCAQLRMAETAESQSTLNVIGVLLLGATLVATAFAAIFTGLTWRTMEDTGKRELRAYINVTEANITRMSTGGVPVAQVVLKNCGTTPAYRVTLIAQATITSAASPKILTFEPTARRRMFGVIGPTLDVHFRVTMDPFPEHERGAIQEGRKVVYVFGRLEYQDAFDAPRWTTFRMVYDEVSWADPNGQMIVCEEGNDAN
jgi:hypothetical protein